jgi:hypothetical protein
MLRVSDYGQRTPTAPQRGKNALEEVQIDGVMRTRASSWQRGEGYHKFVRVSEGREKGLMGSVS